MGGLTPATNTTAPIRHPLPDFFEEFSGTPVVIAPTARQFRSVRGAVTSVSVTLFGQTATADVHPLPATGGRQVGAYAVWLPRSGADRDGMNLSDITAVVGRDAAGSVVTRLD